MGKKALKCLDRPIATIYGYWGWIYPSGVVLPFRVVLPFKTRKIIMYGVPPSLTLTLEKGLLFVGRCKSPWDAAPCINFGPLSPVTYICTPLLKISV